MLNRYEKETIITYNDEDMKANIYTCNKGLQNKLLKYSKEFPDRYRLISQDKESKTFETFKDLVTLRKPYNINKEHRQNLSKRLKELNNKKASSKDIS